MSGAKVIFDIRGSRTKHLALHPNEPWIVIITQANVVELWNYDSKILLKSFNSMYHLFSI